MRLADRTAFITGGGRGIGRAVALAFAREGARVFVVARTAAEVQRVAAEVNAESGHAAAHAACDVADPRSVEAAFAAARDFFGAGIDVLVNNAGVADSSKFAETSDEFWRRHLDVNLTGTFYCMRAALPPMVEKGWGRVVNVASVAGKTGAPYVAAYAASKHGVLGLTRSVALEVARTGVTVNAVCPGYVETPMAARVRAGYAAAYDKSEDAILAQFSAKIPLGRYSTPEEVAGMVGYLASDPARSVLAQALNVCGGLGNF